MSFYEWPAYVSVGERRRQAARQLTELRKHGRQVSPVTIEGRKIAASFWGMSWCSNLERYSDYASRLPRGRSYVRNGSVLDLQITRGKVAATVAGSELYDIAITIAPVPAPHWRAICRDCAGTVDTLVELLQGKLSKSVMDRVCRQGDGLFPSPREIELSCSCPDSASMCKHVAAALYGVGARLDRRPELLFVLRGVDQNELIAGAGEDLSLTKATPGSAKLLDDGDVAALFGLEIADSPGSGDAMPVAADPPAPSTRVRAAKPAAGEGRSPLKPPKPKPGRKPAARLLKPSRSRSSA